VLRIQSGDVAELSSFPAGGCKCLPADLSLVPAECLVAIVALWSGQALRDNPIKLLSSVQQRLFSNPLG
jgi:hypothetical protein